MMNTELDKKEIPKEVIEEIESVYVIDWVNYGNSTEDMIFSGELKLCTSKRLKYEVVYDDVCEREYMCPNDFVMKKIEAPTKEGFMIRGNFNEDDKIVRLWKVQKIGPVIDISGV